MKVVLLRHAQTAGNLLRQYIGKSDEALSEEGRRYALSLPQQPQVNTVVTSALVRTVQTAQILYPHAKPVCCSELNEMDFGLFEQKSAEDLKDDASYRAWVDAYCTTACPKGESQTGFVDRCTEAFLRIAQEEASLGTAELHFVIHGGSIRAILSKLATPERPFFDWPVDYCGGYELQYDPDSMSARPLRLIHSLEP